jgi:DNA (cytosine-5)-methyltransferase 1
MRIVDLFSGAGGLTFGFYYSIKDGKFIKNEDCEIVFANEENVNAAKAFTINFPDVNMLNCDIRNLKEQTIFNIIGTKEIDLIIGGPPCQSFSTIGVRKYDDKAKLYKEYIRMLKIIRPKMFIFENVKGILSMKDGANNSVINRIMGRFEKIEDGFGYNVSYRILDAVEYGIPQNRERVFIVGVRKDQDIIWSFPEGNNTRLTIKEAINDLPSLKQGEEKVNYKEGPLNDYQKLMRDSNKLLTYHRTILHNDKIQMVIKNIAQGQGRYDFNKLVDEGLVEEKYRLTSGYSNTYGRLIAKKPCTTITHNMSTASSLRCVHYRQNRTLTPREGARIQSFPDWFQFCGNFTEIRMQIGNAVPPLLAIALHDQAQKALNGR